MFDLTAYIAERAAPRRRRAVRGSRRSTPTPTRTRFFSYRRTTHRREPDYGRLVSAIALA